MSNSLEIRCRTRSRAAALSVASSYTSPVACCLMSVPGCGIVATHSTDRARTYSLDRVDERVPATNGDSAHQEAYRLYLGGILNGDFALVRTKEWSRLTGRAWHFECSKSMSGEPDGVEVARGHACLIQVPTVAHHAAPMSQVVHWAG